jgi:hypothetical protein
VEGHWPAIKRVAKALIERDTLTGDEVRDLIFPRRGASFKTDEQGVTRMFGNAAS